MLKMKKTMFAVVAVAALCAASLNVEAKTAAKNAPVTTGSNAKMEESQAKPARPIPFYGKIGTVDKANKTFTIEGKKSTRTFTLTDSTKMDKMGAAATWDDLKTGEYVRGSAMKKSEGQYEAMSVKIGQKEKTASAAKPESKAKK